MVQGSLAVRLQALRARRGLTLSEASTQLGINRHTLGRLEAGTQKPYGPTLKKLAEGYGVPVEDLIEEPATPLAQAPPPPETSEEERRLYPYPWMADALASLIEHWQQHVEKQTSSGYSLAIAWACYDTADRIVRAHVAEWNAAGMPERWEGMTPQERAPWLRARAERHAVMDALYAIADKGRRHYEESEAASRDEIESLEQHRQRQEDFKQRQRVFSDYTSAVDDGSEAAG